MINKLKIDKNKLKQQRALKRTSQLQKFYKQIKIFVTIHYF